MEVIGVDAGATWVKATRFDDGLKPIKEAKEASGAGQGVEQFFASIVTAITECETTEETPVGLSFAGIISPDQKRLMMSLNIKGLEEYRPPGIDITEGLRQYHDVPKIVLGNDADLAALAEWQHGLGQGDKAARLLHLTWGTGVGTGFVTESRYHVGWEAGLIPLGLASDETTKILEEHVQVPTLVAKAEEAFQAGQLKTDFAAKDFSDKRETPKKLVALAEQGDELAVSILREAAAIMAQGIHTMALISYPTIVTIGGAFMSSDWLLEEVRQAVADQSIGPQATSLTADLVHRGKLGNDAGMLGAALLARETFK